MTSHDVVAKARRALGERRIGHAGTLDPDASGVLVLGIGVAARLTSRLTLATKRYVFTVVLGSETTTDDAAGETVATAEVPAECGDRDFVERFVAGWARSYDQVPPQFSAISKDGVRAYDLARKGVHVELEARPVTISDITLLAVRDMSGTTEWLLDATVSKGTYIRSIARDMGRELGCYAHVGELRRTASGDVAVSDCVSLEDLESGGLAFAREHLLDPVRLLGYPVRTLTDAEAKAALDGKRIGAGDVAAPGGNVSLVHDGKLVGIWTERDGVLVCDVNFPQGIEGIGLDG
jgi:tRNA pseudouridine55 synthase